MVEDASNYGLPQEQAKKDGSKLQLPVVQVAATANSRTLTDHVTALKRQHA